MGLFVRRSNGPSDKYGAIVYYIDDDGFVRRSNGPSDKYGAIAYYIDDDGFVRRSNGPSNKYGEIVYYVDADGFVRKSNGPSDKYGAIVYYADADGFVRKSNGPSEKYGQIVYYAEKEKNEKEQQSQEPSADQKKGALLLIGLVLGLIFAPILIVLGMFGKFLLGGLFENVLPLEAFKKFRKTYSVINIVWLTLGIAAIVVLAILEIDVSIPLFTLVGGNILLFVLSIVFGNKIYKEHKHELPQPVEEPTETEDDTATSEEAFAEELDEQIEFAPDTTNSIQNNLAAIKQLKELLDMGAITQKEFEDKKQLLLGEAFVPQKPNAQAGSNNQAPASTEALIKRAYAFLQSKETRKARGYFEKALDIEPNNSEALTGTLLLELGLTSLEELEEGTLFFNKSKAYARINSLCSDLSYYENALEKIKENNYKLLNKAKEAKDYSAIIKFASNLLTYEKEKEKLAILVFLAKFKADSVADLEKMQVDYGKSSEYKELTAYLSKENKELFESTLKAIKNKKKKKVIIIISAIAAVLLIIGIVLAVYFTSDTYIYGAKGDGSGGIVITDYHGSGGDITIPEKIDGKPVTTIGYDAFYGCDSLKSIVIPNGVTTIGSYAFYSCDSLTSIVIPSSVTTIGYEAFYSCSSLTSIVIPNSVTTIGESAFYDCDSLKSVVIPNSVTTIESSAFASCDSLTIYCEIEESEKPWGWDSYWNDGCHVVWGNTGGAFGETEDGYKWAETINGVIIFGYKGGKTDIEIPSEINGKPVTAIGEKAFSNCRSLTSVVIPNSVTTIGEYAFSDCDSLTSVVIPNSVTIIGERAFSYCTSLTSIVIPNSITTIGNSAFSYCSSLTSIVIPNSVTTIGDYAFSFCGSLTIYCEADSKPEGWSSYWKDSDCPVVWGKCITEDGFVWKETTNGVIIFGYKGGKTDIEIPSEINGKPVTAIGERAFSNCRSLTSVVIPNSVTAIGEYAFSFCDSLTSIVIPNSVTTIGKYAFSSCDALTSVVISNGVTTIGKSAFSNCSSLTIYCEIEESEKPEGWDSSWNDSNRPVVWGNTGGAFGETEDGYKWAETQNGITVFDYTGNATTIEIPSEINGKPVTAIGEKAFYDCDSLESVVIPNGVTTIGEYAFSSCSSLKSVVIPSSVTTIGNGVFAGCDSITSVVIPNSVTIIGERAFSYCTSLTSIVIPNSITTIGNSAFSYCSSLTSVVIPNSVTTIGEDAFRNCDFLTIYCEADSKPEGWSSYWKDSDCPVVWGNIGGAFGETEDGFKWAETQNGITVFDYTGNATTLEIPSEINGKPVTAIGEKAFYDCISLESIVIPNSVTTIGNSAFYNCSSLESVVIPNNVTTIENSAFSNCDALTSVVIPNSVTTIGTYAFSNCDALTSVVISNGVTTIGECAFYNCTSLESVVIPNSVTTIGEDAFFWCSSLTIYCEIEESEKPEGWSSYWKDSDCPVVWGKCITEDGFVWKETTNGVIIFGYKGGKTDIEIPSKINGKPVTTIGDYAFSKYSSLTSVVIPNGVTTIGEEAFYYCYSLTSIVIPNSVTTIGNSAFYNCNSLKSVVIPNSVTTIGEYAFSYCSSLKSVVIPNSVTTIGERAFYYCYSLTIYCEIEEAEKPEGWDSSWNDSNRPVVWGGCITEDGIVWEETTNGVIITDYIGGKTDIEIPSEINGKPVTTIGEKAFYDCTSLTSVVIPNSVTIIGSYAFNGCGSLTGIAIPNSVTTIESYAFYRCTSLISIVIPNGVTTIGEYAFSSCSLKSIVIPNSVTTIGGNAFDGCIFLESVVIPNSVTAIGIYAFSYCTSLTSVVIPNSVTTIGYDAFYNCRSLTIYCEIEESEKPEGWNSYWHSGRPVVWGHSHTFENGSCVCGTKEN